MKREILFRGKSIASGEWVYGWYCVMSGIDYIIPENQQFRNPADPDIENSFIEVDPDTVGQFMGLTDKNGNKIFEGDILQRWELDYETWEKNNFEVEEPFIATKKDVATMLRFPVFWLQNESFGYEGSDLEDADEWEIIGNIHDNPELKLEEKDESEF